MSYRIIITVNASNLSEVRLLASKNMAYFDFHDSEDEEGGRDVVLEWPINNPDAKQILFSTWWRQFAMPMLNCGATFSIHINDDKNILEAGLVQHYPGMEPKSYIKADTEKLTGEVGKALDKIKAIIGELR